MIDLANSKGFTKENTAFITLFFLLIINNFNDYILNIKKSFFF